ncbi:MAG: hypothetical protein IPJ14_22880 [Kineosporiaceae bacterium]|nr:hypothetical protein [Kineosporiaceae bacterium]
MAAAVQEAAAIAERLGEVSGDTGRMAGSIPAGSVGRTSLAHELTGGAARQTSASRAGVNALDELTRDRQRGAADPPDR